MELEKMWPPFAVRIHASDGKQNISMRVMRDTDIAAIDGVTPEEIYGAEIPQHAFGWLFDGDPYAAARMRWEHRARMTPEEWSLDFVVCMDEEIIGVVDMRGSEFAVHKEVSTGSWIYHRHQGKGLGTLVRHAVAGFCFGELGAQALSTGWVQDNHASERVSMKLGYELYDVGLAAALPCGPEKIELPIRRARLARDRYNNAGYTVTVDGITGALRQLLGASPSAA